MPRPQTHPFKQYAPVTSANREYLEPFIHRLSLGRKASLADGAEACLLLSKELDRRYWRYLNGLYRRMKDQDVADLLAWNFTIAELLRRDNVKYADEIGRTVPAIAWQFHSLHYALSDSPPNLLSPLDFAIFWAMCHQHLSFAHLMEIQKAAFPLRPLEPDYPPDIGYRPYLVGFDECEKQMESYIAKLTIEIQRLQRTACKNAAFTAKWLDRTTQNSWTPYQLRHQMRQARRDQYPDTPELVHEFFLTVSSVDLPPLSDTAPELSATPTGDDD